jgi:branched-chain amino acid transport system substrate-binding protein
MKKFNRLSVVAAAGSLVVTSALTVSMPSANALDCTGTVAIMAPLTGPVAAIGVEQANFAKLAVADYNEKNGTTFTTKDYDTQLDAAQASTQAPNVISDKTTIGLVGPAGSQEVLVVGGLLDNKNIAIVSSSATRPNLTSGTFPTFFRVVPNDAQQGPYVANYMVKTLKAKEIVVIEEKTAYGTGLSTVVMATLKKLNVKATKISVNEKGADYASVVTRVSKTTDFVFVTFQDAAKSENVAQELIKQKKKAVVFGSDGSDQKTFKTEGTYVSAFAADVREFAAAKTVIDDYLATYKAELKDISTFGPPAYVAAQAIVEAAGRVCKAGKAADAASTLAEVRKTKIAKTILDAPLVFTATGDVKGAEIYIFKTQKDGTRKLVG